MTLLRTQRDGCWELRSNSWGQFLAPTVDPDADTVISQEQLEGFELHEGTPRIPVELWNRWVKLCIEMVKRGTGDLEVSCRLLRHIDNPDQYRICVPQQKVTGVSVRVESFDKAVDIETGEIIEQWPPEGWRACGSSHSHNTMQAFFSGTDDKYELGDPGLHIVVGEVDVTTGNYTMAASITANHRRFLIEPNEVVDYLANTQPSYHPNCLEVIQTTASAYKRTAPPTVGSYKSPTYSSYTPRLNPLEGSVVQDEINVVRASVEALIVRAKALDANYKDILQELAMEIDESAYGIDPLNDPFYWSTDDFLSTY